MENTSYKNKVVVVTGASAGIGRAIVREFAKEGANIGLLELTVWKEPKPFTICRQSKKGSAFIASRAQSLTLLLYCHFTRYLFCKIIEANKYTG